MRAEDSESHHKKLSRDEIWDQILSFMIAGHETTSLDSTIGVFNIKKGQTIAVSPLVPHRDPRWWKKKLYWIKVAQLEIAFFLKQQCSKRTK